VLIITSTRLSRDPDALTSTNVPTLCALFANHSTSVHIFVALNNADYLSGALNTSLRRVHELDWWDERLLRVALPSNVGGPAVSAEVRISCTPSQHVSGRIAFDRWHALWTAWVVEDLHSHKKLFLLATRDILLSGTEKTRTKFRCALHSPKLANVLVLSTSLYCRSGAHARLLLVK
jgi:hypothetical protein